MNSEDLVFLEPHLYEVALSAGQRLYEPGELVDQVYFPSSAVISVVTAMLDGRGVETATIGFESCTGLLATLSNRPAFSQAFAQVPGGAVRLAASKIRERAFASQNFMKLLLHHVDANACQTQQSAACNALHTALARMARWLLMTQDRTDSARLPLTQEYLAIMLGLQRTTVTLVAGELKAMGLIRYQRGQITVVDRAGLEAVACECYQVIRERSERLSAQRVTTPSAVQASSRTSQ